MPVRGLSGTVRHGGGMPDVPQVLLGLLAIMTLVLANGFFVAAEFALVTVR